MEPTTPLLTLYRQSDSNPEGIACISGHNIWNYRRLALAVEQLAQGLHARGVQPGDRVVLHMLNVAELVIAYFACFRIGAVAAPLNTRFKTTELRAALKRLRPAMYIGQAHLYAQVAPIETDILAADARYVVGETILPGRARPWKSLLEGTSETALPGPPHPDSPAVLLCTSGATGLPKFVTHTAATLAATSEGLRWIGLEISQIAINSVPLVHASGLFSTLTCLRYGSVIVLLERFDADVVLSAIDRFHGTRFVGLPFMFAELLRRQRLHPRRVNSLEFCAASGDVCPPKLQQEFPDLFGVQLHSAWASTEVAGSLIHGLVAGPVSRTAPGAQVRLVDDNGVEVPRGEVGELLIRGPNVAVGYWVSPDRIDPATSQGWFHTGDLMRRGEKDDLWFVGRKKDVIIRGGSNISPLEVERALLDHPTVLDAAVVGVSDSVRGQAVVGFVHLAASYGEYVIHDILTSARAQLADYKVPEHLYAVAEIPRNASGKIDRLALLSMLQAAGAARSCANT